MKLSTTRPPNETLYHPLLPPPFELRPCLHVLGQGRLYKGLVLVVGVGGWVGVGGGGLEMVLWFFLYLPLSSLPPTRPVSMRLKSKQAGRGKDSKKGENALHIIYSIFISSPVKLYFMEHFPPPFPHPPLWIIKNIRYIQ